MESKRRAARSSVSLTNLLNFPLVATAISSAVLFCVITQRVPDTRRYSSPSIPTPAFTTVQYVRMMEAQPPNTAVQVDKPQRAGGNPAPTWPDDDTPAAAAQPVVPVVTTAPPILGEDVKQDQQQQPQQPQQQQRVSASPPSERLPAFCKRHQRQVGAGPSPVTGTCASAIITQGMLCPAPQPHTPAIPDAEADNALANGRFEDRERETGLARSWDPVSHGYYLAETAGRVGGVTPALGTRRCIALRGGGGAKQRATFPQTLEAGQCVYISAWSRMLGAEVQAPVPVAEVTVYLENGGRAAVVDSWVLPLKSGPDWALSFAMRSSRGAFNMVEVSIRAPDTGKGVAIIDDVKFTVVNKDNLCPIARTLDLVEYESEHLKRFEAHAEEGAQGECATQECADKKFFLVWSTNASTFKIEHLRTIESILYHHPLSCLCVYSNTLPMDWFYDLWATGYNVRVVRHRVESIGASLPAGNLWASKVDEWRKGPYFYSHVTDFLRFSLLYKYGGVYSDTDSVLLRRLDLENTMATMRRPDLDWAVNVSIRELPELFEWSEVKPNSSDTQSYTLAPGFMTFEKGNAFLEAALRKLDETYQVRNWVAAGPRPATLAYRENQAIIDSGGMKVELFRPSMFLPISFNRIQQGNMEPLDKLWRKIRSECRAIHLYGRVQMAKGAASVLPGSLVHKALTEYQLGCAPALPSLLNNVIEP